MKESFYSCIREPSTSTSDETAEKTERCCANEGCVGDSDDVLTAQMISPACDSENSLSRCSSSTSLATYTQYFEPDALSSDEQDASVDTLLETTQSFGTRWTDDKHSSYLRSMEATFVKNLYDRVYCALDLCGQAPHHMDYDDPDCAESQPKLAFELKEFKACRNGYSRPKVLDDPSILSSSRALLTNPWVKRFRYQVSRTADVRSQKDSKSVLSRSDFEEGENVEPRKYVSESSPQDPEAHAENVVEMWLERLQSHHFTSSSKLGVQKESERPSFPVSMNSNREASTLKQQFKQSSHCKRSCIGSLPEERQEVDSETRSSKATFEQRLFRKQKTSGEVLENVQSCGVFLSD